MQRIPDNEKSDMLNMDSYWENKAERKTPIQYTNTYIYNLERW